MTTALRPPARSRARSAARSPAPRRASARTTALAVLGAGTLVLAAACGDDTAAPPEPEPDPTTTTAPVDDPDPAPECDPDAVFAVVDTSLERARLAPGGGWTVDGDDSAFADRLADPGEFADRLALDCAARAVQPSADGTDRLVLAAWTGPRIVYVLHASDEPSSPYEPAAVFDLLDETPRGEFVEGGTFPERERTTWAATLGGGATFLVSSDDYPIGAVAKAWQAGLEFPEPEEFVSLDAERYGIDRLREAGARNVDVGELPDVVGELLTILDC